MSRQWIVSVMLGSSLVGMSAGLAAQERQSTNDWLERCRERRGRDAHACDVREVTMARPSGALQVNAKPNGGITVTGWDRSDILVRAKIQAQARAQSDAEEILGAIAISTEGGEVSATGPNRRGRRSWSVSYEVFVPRTLDLSLQSTNGGLRVLDIDGTLALRTTNGGIALDGVAGDVQARTTNGGIKVTLIGDRWDGKGLEARTTNGSVSLRVPEGYSAHLETGTRNGGITVGFPIQVQGRIGRTLSTDIGGGGATISATTTNGSVRILRSETK